MILIKIYKDIKFKGVGYTLKKIINIIKSKIVNIFYLYEINLEDCMSEINIKDEEYEFKLITKDIINQMREEKIIPSYKINILENRVNNYKETLNYVVLNKEKNIMGYFAIALVNTKKNPYINKYLKIPEKTTYFFDSYTLEKYRRRGVQKFALLKKLNISKELGYEKSIILTFDYNIPAQKAFEMIGMKRKSKIYELNIFGKKIYERVIK